MGIPTTHAFLVSLSVESWFRYPNNTLFPCFLYLDSGYPNDTCFHCFSDRGVFRYPNDTLFPYFFEGKLANRHHQSPLWVSQWTHTTKCYFLLSLRRHTPSPILGTQAGDPGSGPSHQSDASKALRDARGFELVPICQTLRNVYAL